LRGASITRRPARSKETPCMLANFDNVLDRLTVSSRDGAKAMCFCPVHDDRNNPSLSLKAQNGRLLLHCFAGCQPEDIVSKIELEMKDLFVEGGGGSSIPPNTPARYQRKSAYQWAERACKGRCTLRTRLHTRRVLRREEAAGGLLAGLGLEGRELLGQARRPHPLSRRGRPRGSCPLPRLRARHREVQVAKRRQAFSLRA
jgi:hypothetical protein